LRNIKPENYHLLCFYLGPVLSACIIYTLSLLLSQSLFHFSLCQNIRYLSVKLTSPMSRNNADNRNLHFRENMALPGVGVFPGENPEFIVRHLREAGFPVKAVWAQVSSTQVPYCSLKKIVCSFRKP